MTVRVPWLMRVVLATAAVVVRVTVVVRAAVVVRVIVVVVRVSASRVTADAPAGSRRRRFLPRLTAQPKGIRRG